MKKIFIFLFAFVATSAFGQAKPSAPEDHGICLYDGKAYTRGSVIADQVGGALICSVIKSAPSENAKDKNEYAYWERIPKAPK